MKPIVAKQIINEINLALRKVWLLKAFLGGAVVFLLVYLVLLLINLPTFQIALVIGILYFITEMVAYSRTDPLLLVEKRYETLNETLRTVRDTLPDDNELVNTLREDVRSRVHHLLDIGDFIDFRRALTRTFFILFMSFSIVLLASLNIKVVDAEQVIDTSLNFIKDLGAQTFKEGRDKLQVVQGDQALQSRFTKVAAAVGISAGEQAGDDIFGDSQLAQLGDEKLRVEIRPTDFEVSVGENKPPERLEFIDQQFQGSIDEQKEASLQEDIPQEQQAIVRRYFEELARS